MAAYSKLQPVSATCIEYVHPWSDNCIDASAGLLVHAIQDSARIYITVYTLALLMRGKIPQIRDIKRTLFGILQSTAFLSMSGFSYSLLNCFIRKLLGHYNFFTVSFIPAFISSVLSILIERPSRRGLLCLYVANVATETVWRMAVARNYVKPIKYGEVAIFGISTAVLMCYFRGGQHKDGEKNDSMFDLLRFVVGPCEEKGFAEKRSNQRADTFYRQQVQNIHTDPNVPRQSYPRSNYRSGRRGNHNIIYHLVMDALRMYKRIIYKIKCGVRHSVCPHPFSCVFYTLQGGLKLFSVGFGLQLCLKLLLQAKRIIRRPKLLKTVLINKNILSLGLFLGGYSALFRLTSCMLRWATNKDSQYFALPAGLIASIAFTQYPDNTVALYVMWKMLQRTYSMGVAHGVVNELPGFTVFLYALSTATLFHAAIIEPTNLRPSYWKFLHSLSGERIAAMARPPIDVWGLNSTKSLEEVLKKTRTTVDPSRLKF